MQSIRLFQRSSLIRLLCCLKPDTCYMLYVQVLQGQITFTVNKWACPTCILHTYFALQLSLLKNTWCSHIVYPCLPCCINMKCTFMSSCHDLMHSFTTWNDCRASKVSWNLFLSVSLLQPKSGSVSNWWLPQKRRDRHLSLWWLRVTLAPTSPSSSWQSMEVQWVSCLH